MTNNTALLDKALLVFARHLADEMRYINYPKEWSGRPLTELLPKLFEVLNHHPEKLGDIVRVAYERTFPTPQRGNINQLGSKMVEPTKDYELFGKTRQYYLDEYEAIDSSREVSTVKNDPLAVKLDELYSAIVNTFAGLTPAQENEHRTLERVCFALAPVYRCIEQTKEIGFDLAEYTDQWRNMPSDERVKLKAQLLAD
jgi:hypothetical protein